MMYNKLTHANILRTNNDRFETTTIVRAMNNLRATTADAADDTELLDLMVLGQIETQPTKLRVIGKVLYKSTNRVVAVPYEVDAGALRGLETEVEGD